MGERAITNSAIKRSSNLTEEEKNEFINYLTTKNVPERLGGPEKRKKRDLLRKASRKFTAENVVTSNSMKKELVYIIKDEKRFVLQNQKYFQNF